MISICRVLLQHICFNFAQIWGWLMISGPWIPEFQDSGSDLELASFNWYQHIGYESRSFYVKKLDFQHRISKFHHSWKLPEIFWNSGYCLKFWYSVLKIKFLDINWVGCIPYMLISVKASQFQGTSRILEFWNPGSRNH